MLILEFQIQLLKVLCWLVQLVQSEDLLVSDLDLASKLLSELYFSLKLRLQLINNILILLTSLISTSDLVCPLVLVNKCPILGKKTSVHGVVGVILMNILLQQMCRLDALLVCTKHVCGCSVVKLR